MLAWDADTGRPLTPIVTWQDKRSQKVLDRLEATGQGEEIRERSGMPLDPVLLGRQAGVAARARRGRPACARRGHVCGWAPSTPSCATGSGPGSRPTRRPHPEPNSARPSGIRRCSNCSVCQPRCPARDRGHDRGARRASPPVLAPGAPVAGAVRRSAGGPRGRRVRAARAGQGDLRDRRVRARPRRERAAVAGRRAAADDRLERRTAASSGRSTAACSPPGALLEWLSRDLGLAADPAALAAAAATVTDAGGVKVLPALAGVGAPWWKPDGARR